MYVIAQMVLVGPIIFPMIGRYQIYVMDVIAQLVLAGPTMSPMIGQYQIYMIFVIAQMVLASPIIFPMISQYQIYMVFGFGIAQLVPAGHIIISLYCLPTTNTMS